MLAFERLPKRIATTPAILAGAQSAWALSLPRIAIERFERALRDPSLTEIERARIELSRGVIELQEANPQSAVLYAERALKKLPQVSSLRSKVWLLWAESLMRMGSTGAAEEKYKSALAEAATEDQAEIHFLSGRCAAQLGHFSDAAHHLSKIPLNHHRAAEAIRELAEISLSSGDDEQTAFWLETGRSRFPDKFLDSWVDYARVSLAIKNKERAQIEEILRESQNKYAPSDPWRTLLEASVESFYWNERHEERSHD
jgi:hypothetical protein